MTEMRQRRLPDGLHVTLIHQPDASQAAALAQVAAGSHDEPDAWPGLAHLLEHLLFSDSEGYRESERLMPWVQAAGGRLNATTLLRSSAWFFEVEAGLLGDGVARLADMLAAPQFSPEAIAQETRVIDAEYRLIQQHTPSRREAALFSRVSTPDAFQRFHVGSRAAFGSDSGALKQALHQFHQRFFVAGQMTLWLQGPQPLDELEQLAQDFSQRFLPGAADNPAGPSEPVRFVAAPDVALETQAEDQLWITHYLRGDAGSFRDSVTILREFLLDEAPEGVMATLRQRHWAQALEGKWLSLDRSGGWLAWQFATSQPDAVCAAFSQVLYALMHTTPQQQRHYLHLAQQRFALLTPLDQLRERAFGFVPPEHISEFVPLLHRLAKAPQVRLWSAASVQGTTVDTQGFRLSLRPWRAEPWRGAALPELRFHPLAPAGKTLTPPDARAPLLHCAAGDTPATLLLRPDFFTSLSPATAAHFDRQLRPLFALLRHQGGAANWQEKQGSWQLLAQLPAGDESWLASLPDALRAEGKGNAAPPAEDVAIRELLRQLPLAVSTLSDSGYWRAALYGGSTQQHATVARWLAPVVAGCGRVAQPDPGGKTVMLDHHSADHALLLFLPCPANVSLAALRALALLMEPRFFQRMRVEQQTGYVASCRYHRCADRDGILFALQSPDIASEALLTQCQIFVHQLALPDDADTLKTGQARLHAALSASSQADSRLQRALRHAQGMRDLDASAIDALTPAALHQARAQLLHEWHHSIVLRTR
ncbi:pyrroloquinoline quinone biosynthesis protein PqqF [Pantoea sp. KPR_PJ]|uniref:pyrroloquinoline quinone biosynthesis protein PqqF n=1 Tax=Pantoea sp. KPR_PJ TaxID=2738375 RepID=UPI0035278886